MGCPHKLLFTVEEGGIWFQAELPTGPPVWFPALLPKAAPVSPPALLFTPWLTPAEVAGFVHPKVVSRPLLGLLVWLAPLPNWTPLVVPPNPVGLFMVLVRVLAELDVPGGFGVVLDLMF